MSRPFIVGDRVRVYACPDVNIGIIESIMPGINVLRVKVEGLGWIRALPQQCRRIKPKPKRRRVWVKYVTRTAWPLGFPDSNGVTQTITLTSGHAIEAVETEPADMAGYTEFVEVRRK